VVICRSTVPVGTTRGLVMSALEEASGLKAGVDFDLAYSSERIAEGRAYDEFRTMPLVVGGINANSLERAAEVLGAINTRPVFKASSIELVEAAKMFENAQRDVNIAVANQVARFANRFDIPAWELIDACNTHTRVKILAPGIGVGGRLHPLPPLRISFGSLTDAGERDELLPTFVSAREANAAQPAYIAGRMSQALHGTSGRRVLFVGIAMKDYSDDVTVSPAVALARTLEEAGAVVHVLDDVADVPAGFDRETDLSAAVRWAEAVVLPIRQSGVDYDMLRRLVLGVEGRLCVCDFRGIFRETQPSPVSPGTCACRSAGTWSVCLNASRSPAFRSTTWTWMRPLPPFESTSRRVARTWASQSTRRRSSRQSRTRVWRGFSAEATSTSATAWASSGRVALSIMNA